MARSGKSTWEAWAKKDVGHVGMASALDRVGMMLVDPIELFQGVIVIAVPHMDDGVLACGGTIAKLPRKERIHVIYATDGKGSPAPILPGRDSVSPDLGLLRMGEALEAMRQLGVPQENVYFLGLPDSQLKKHWRALHRSLTELIEEIKPTYILTPFRYDRHSDHLALNRVLTDAYQKGKYEAELIEYFVYHHWRLLPKGDVRKYIHPEYLLEVNIEAVSAQKRAALDCFRTQTTRFYAWQTRPNLLPEFLDEVSRTPEIFLRYDPSWPGTTIFTRSIPWIRLAHKLEPYLKKKKDQAVALWCKGFTRNDRKAD